MVTVTAQLTPNTDTNPVVVRVEKELSGKQWCTRFPGSQDVSTLRPSFQLPVGDFIAALEHAGALVVPNATFRPKQRAFLMETCWLIANGFMEPDKAPSRDGINIEWVHSSKAKSIAAAKAMSHTYGMQTLATKPAGEKSLHCIGEAIDMNISWSGTLTIEQKDGTSVVITSTPRTGMNAELAKVGASYGVIKFYGGAADRPHWSTTGR